MCKQTNTEVIVRETWAKPVGTREGFEQICHFHSKYIQAQLPAHIKVKVLLSAARDAALRNPRLLECSGQSWYAALLHCARTGLLPDTPQQECHLIPYKGEVKWICGWRGFIKLARQSRDVAYIAPEVVYEGDEFYYQKGTEPKIVHVEDLDPNREDPTKLTHAYAVVFWRDKDIPPDFVVMGRADIERVKRSAQGTTRADSPWKVHPAEQWKKSAVRNLGKRLPQGPELAYALKMEDHADTHGQPYLEPADKEKVNIEDKSKTDRLAAELAKKAEPTNEGGAPAITLESVIKLMDEHRDALPDKFNKYTEERLESYTLEALADVYKEIKDAIPETEPAEERPESGPEAEQVRIS